MNNSEILKLEVREYGKMVNLVEKYCIPCDEPWIFRLKSNSDIIIALEDHMEVVEAAMENIDGTWQIIKSFTSSRKLKMFFNALSDDSISN